MLNKPHILFLFLNLFNKFNKTWALNQCKTLYLLFLLFFQAAAAGLIFMGAWVYHTYNHFSELTTANLTLIPAAIVISVGVFLFIIGCLGCIAACKENKCLLAIVSKELDASFLSTQASR